MTEKDAVKCHRFADARYWCLPVRARIESALIERVIASYGVRNSRNRTLMDPKLLEMLVCPVTKGPLIYDRDRQELLSKSARLAYPIRDGIPVMLEEEARKLTPEECEELKP
jgi:uncharacterized protein YbaR (Trm112 family)